jgi:hypothetical protein
MFPRAINQQARPRAAFGTVLIAMAEYPNVAIGIPECGNQQADEMM